MVLIAAVLVADWFQGPNVAFGSVLVAVPAAAAVNGSRRATVFYEVIDSPWGVRAIMGDVRGKGLRAVRKRHRPRRLPRSGLRRTGSGARGHPHAGHYVDKQRSLGVFGLLPRPNS
ncbi:hypothetical protein [Streptomyces sp. NBC_01808]|uniref:hypothetical protein n=1 Tax=Streptomyces sp. NBC_01808 TaxID=2975947 RepID=UPI002DDC245B|nr:hypothetical protein [Streptomyces sp. NBC_01808]